MLSCKLVVSRWRIMLKMQKKKTKHKKPQKTKLVTEICFHAHLTCLSKDSLSGFNSEYSNIVVSVQYFVWSAFLILRDKLLHFGGLYFDHLMVILSSVGTLLVWLYLDENLYLSSVSKRYIWDYWILRIDVGTVLIALWNTRSVCTIDGCSWLKATNGICAEMHSATIALFRPQYSLVSIVWLQWLYKHIGEDRNHLIR